MTIPNLISLARLLAIIPISVYLVRGAYGWALLLMLLAGLSDMVDGLLARLYNWRSRLGSILDPAADKLLVVGVATTLTYLKIMPLWFLSTLLLRDLLIGVAFFWLWRRRLLPEKIKPFFTSKVAVALQIVIVVAAVANLYFGGAWPMMALYILGTAATLLSLLHYLWIWPYLKRPVATTTTYEPLPVNRS